MKVNIHPYHPAEEKPFNPVETTPCSAAIVKATSRILAISCLEI
jgi:hypothetical protein